ncbi:hypothetical protein TRICI_005972 [Trichomonascus ciferrii]|uniref:WIBG Mago-binding domain-containing protein n=1 Tax=Trichomonascus ciferrii TaxID=44093 RepID=A0A642UU60_9ASCO|nr:hypothetical protein TRICI_005972 [Trichomonascus ciferrii]
MDKVSASGIHTAEDGSRYVGGSVRPDGSVRRARKVKPGYVPEEDVPKYVPIGRRRALGQEAGGIIPKASVDSEQNKSNSSRERVGQSLRSSEGNGRPVRRSVRPVLDEKEGEESSEGQATQSRGRAIRSTRQTRPVLDDENKRPVRPVRPVVTDDDEADELIKGISGLSLNNATKVTTDVNKTKEQPVKGKDSNDLKQEKCPTKDTDDSPLEKNIKPDDEPPQKDTSSSKKDDEPKQTGQDKNTAPKPSSQKYIPPWKRK